MIKLNIIKRINFPLIIGSILLFVLLVTSIYPDLMATADPYGKQRLEFQTNEGGNSGFLVPPIPPGKEYPWGTDHIGRDLKSLIIYGCKITMVIAVLASLGRLAIALPLAIAGAYKNRFSIWFIKQFNMLFNAFPLVLVVIILVNLQLFNDVFNSEKLILALLLTLFGWSKLAYVLMEKVSEILNQDFVEGEIAIGKSKLEIAVQNIVPHLIPTLIVMFFLEVALVLQTMAQVGIFRLLTTGGYYNADGDINVPYEFDWGSLLIFAYMFFGTDKMYLVLYPAASFAVSIIAFNLFGEGLRIEFEKRTSRVITFIRRIPSYVSPMKLAYEVKNFETHKKTVVVKVICYTLVLLIIFFPHTPSQYKFDSVNAFSTIEELGDEKYRGRLAGSPENKELAEYIAKELEEYGLQPYDGKFIHEFDIKRSVNVKNAELIIKGSLEGDQALKFRKDFIVRSPVTLSGTFEVAKVKADDFYNPSLEEYEKIMQSNIRSKVMIIDLMSVTDYRRMMSTLQFIVKHIQPRAIIFLEGWDLEGDAPKHIVLDKTFANTIVFSVSKEAGDELMRMGQTEIEIKVETDTYSSVKGYNVMGYIPGTDTNKNELILVGSKMDYVGDDKNVRYPGALGASGVAAELEIAKRLAGSSIKPDQSIMFAFWDGSYNEDRGTSYFIKKYIMPGKINGVTYFDLDSLAMKDDKTTLIDTSRVFPKNKDAQNYINLLKENARKQGIKLAYGSISSPIMVDMTSKNVQSLLLSNSGKNKVLTTSKDTVELIDRKRFGKIGQMLLDTLVEIARGK